MRYSITLSYSGRDFCGWQIQPHSPSVQETLEKALSRLLRENVPVTGAGRTDTLVNAIGYVAHFDASTTIENTEDFCYKLNAILPSSIAVSSVRSAPENFHARFDATRREYTYFLNRIKDPFVESYSYRCGYPLDFEAMNRAAVLIKGTHDFSSFEKKGADNKTSICTVFEAFWSEYKPAIHSNEDGYWFFRISADRFLRNMVRAIVGTLIDVGRGKRSVDSITDLLKDGGDRCNAGESVPGHALFLTSVDY